MAAKAIIIFLLGINFSLATQIEVKALNFYSDENKGESVLSGKVLVKRGDDVLSSEKLIIFTDKNRKPIRYEATQEPKFEIMLKGKTYKGSGDKFIYNVADDSYVIDGNAFIHEIQSNKKLYGDMIIIDRKSGVYSVKSKDKNPARFVFDLGQK